MKLILVLCSVVASFGCSVGERIQLEEEESLCLGLQERADFHWLVSMRSCRLGGSSFGGVHGRKGQDKMWQTLESYLGPKRLAVVTYRDLEIRTEELVEDAVYESLKALGFDRVVLIRTTAFSRGVRRRDSSSPSH